MQIINTSKYSGARANKNTGILKTFAKTSTVKLKNATNFKAKSLIRWESLTALSYTWPLRPTDPTWSELIVQRCSDIQADLISSLRFDHAPRFIDHSSNNICNYIPHAVLQLGLFLHVFRHLSYIESQL